MAKPKDITPPTQLGKNLLAYMLARYGTQNTTQFCKDSGLSVGTVGRMLKGTTSIGQAKIEEAAAYIGVTPAELISEEFVAPMKGAKRMSRPAMAFDADIYVQIAKLPPREFQRLEGIIRSYLDGFTEEQREQLEQAERLEQVPTSKANSR